jgi:hypothetical protein
VASAPAPPPTFRTIEELAQLCGRYCWVETRLFELTGQWAGGSGPAEWRVFCSVASGGHAALATEWRDRLPVRAGVDQEALLLPPPGPVAATIEGLHGLAIGEGLPLVINDVLPDLVTGYRTVFDQASPVREAPVMALLVRAATRHAEVAARGRSLLQQG